MKADDSFSYTYEGQTIWYLILSDSTCAVAQGNSDCYGDVIIPAVAVCDGLEYSVTTILEEAFSFNYNMTSITIPHTVTEISNAAFIHSYYLTSIIVSPENSCYASVDGVLFNKDYTKVIRYPINKPDEIYVIPNAVEEINDYAFFGNTLLTSITIGNSVAVIGNQSFDYCWSLTTFTVESENKIYSSSEGVLFDKNFNKLILCPCGKRDNYVIPNSVSEIAPFAFHSSCLTSVTIPNSVTSIGEAAFGSSKLKTVSLPNSITEIGTSTFASCEDLISITIPQSVIIIGFWAFHNCSNLKSINIPNSVTEIRGGAFYDCWNLKSLTIGNSVTSIGNCAFYKCWSLNSVTIPNSVTKIGWSAFRYCEVLTSISIGNSIVEVGDNAFGDCASLESVYIMDIDKWSHINFLTEDANPIYYAKSFSMCDSDEPVKHLDLNLNDGAVSAYAFYGAQNLETVRVKGSEIGKSAFAGCSNVKQLCIDVDELSENTFSGNDNLEAVYCMREVPPTAFDNSFSKYDGVKLYVPEGSVSRYATAEKCWYRFLDDYESNFSDLDEIFGSGSMTEIKDVVADGTDYSDAPVEVYNLNGVKVGDSTEGLQGGLYIVRRGNDVKKIAVK